MKRSIILAALGAFLLALPTVALAGVASTPHDMQAHATASGELCFSCHVPHNAGTDVLWSRVAAGTFTGVQNLCHSCHNGVVSTKGADTVMDIGLEQHKNVGGDCSGLGACHDVHDNTNGGFLAANTAGYDNSCEACHGPTIPAEFTNSLGDHTAVGNHPTVATSFECTQCHTVHGAVAQTAAIGTLTNPILLADNMTTYYGDFCISCHTGTAPTGGTTGSGGVAASNTYNYAESAVDGTALKHPTISTTSGWSGAAVVDGCNVCHDVHNAGSTTSHLLLVENSNSAYCSTCHNGSTGPGTATGGASHPLGTPTNTAMNVGTTNPLPWAQQINDDPGVGGDYPSPIADTMVCETCHSVHRNGVDEYNLRVANGATNAICSECHTAN